MNFYGLNHFDKIHWPVVILFQTGEHSSVLHEHLSTFLAVLQ